jgi:hypothetical protein
MCPGLWVISIRVCDAVHPPSVLIPISADIKHHHRDIKTPRASSIVLIVSTALIYKLQSSPLSYNLHHNMVISSFNALNKIEAGGMKELNDYISRRLDGSAKADAEKPVGLHFLVEEKIFKGTNQPLVSCPIQFRLRDQSPETKLCQPVWTETRHRTKVNAKARKGVKKHSVIRIDDFSVVVHEKALLGYVFFLRSYLVVKKVVDDDAYDRGLME